MRFSAPRSISPSPVRRKHRRGYAFGLQTDSSEDESDSDSSSDGIYTDRSYSDSSPEEASDSEDDLPAYMKRRSPASKQTDDEMREIEETIAAIRLRARHYDPYEEWEKQTRKDAYKTARKVVNQHENELRNVQATTREVEAKQLSELHAKQIADVQAQLVAQKAKQEMEQKRLHDAWEKRKQELWLRVESAIKLEEERVRKKLEEERKKREEEERRRKEEELKRQLEEKKKKEEEERKKKEEEEERKKKEREEQERKALQEKEKREEEQRKSLKSLGMTTTDHDWQQARKDLQKLKTEFMRPVKANPQLKKEWANSRRQITPKIGQITNDTNEINRITRQLLTIMEAAVPNMPVYHALLSSLAKAIIEQAETEVTAEKRSADALGLVAWNLICNIPGLAEILWAKLVQRVGGWAIPCTIPSEADFDGRKWGPGEREKAMGYRKSQTSDNLESSSEYTSRVSGILRVYFSIVQYSHIGSPNASRLQGPLLMFCMPRYWTWFARLLGQKALLETAVAAQLIYTALDIMGLYAAKAWGMQWIKMLQLIYDGVTTGFEEGKFIGGDSPEGKAARVRVQLEVERIMAEVLKS